MSANYVVDRQECPNMEPFLLQELKEEEANLRRVRRHKEQLARLQSAALRSQARVAQLEEALVIKESQLVQTNEKLDGALDMLSAREKLLKKLTRQNDSLKSQLARTKQLQALNQTAYCSEIEGLRCQLEEQNRFCGDLRIQLQRTGDALAESKRQQNQKDIRIQKISKELTVACNQLKRTEAVLESKQDTLDCQEKALAKAVAESAEHQKRIRDLELSNKGLLADNKQLAFMMAEAKAKLQKEQSGRACERQELCRLQMEYQALLEQLKLYECQLESLRGQKQVLALELKQKRGRLRNQEAVDKVKREMDQLRNKQLASIDNLFQNVCRPSLCR